MTMVDDTVLPAQGREIGDTSAVRGETLCRACGGAKLAGLRTCWPCHHVLKFGAARTEAENALAFPWYTLPDPWTWDRVAVHRAGHDIPPRLFPVAMVHGVAAWAVPVNPAVAVARAAYGGRPCVVTE